jgi:hypothetical protein
MQFGQRAEDYVPPVFDENDVWIKRFLPGQTRIRFLQPTKDWTTYREHFDPGHKITFPCAKEAGSDTCLGCDSDSERTRNRSRFYAFNALDEKGRLQVYKLGVKLYKTFQAREQRMDTILDRDYTIIRTGSSKDDTVYDIDPGERYPLDGEIPELNDIPAILGKDYNDALQKFGVTDTSPADSFQSEEPKASKSVKADEAQTQIEAPDEWPTAHLKAYLDEHKVDYKGITARAKLVTLVEKNIAEGGPNF